MSLFDIKPWIVKKKDGTKKQIMPQTSIKGVIGLEKELTSIKAVVENSTGKNLENYVTAQQGPKGPKGDTGAVGPKGPKGDTGANLNGIVQDNDDLNNFKTRGIYARAWSNALIKNIPQNDGDFRAFNLVVLTDNGGNIFQYCLGVSGTCFRTFLLGNGSWGAWTKLADANDINKLQNQINGTGIGRTEIQWPNGTVTGGNGVYKLIKNNTLYINGYGQFNFNSVGDVPVVNIPEAKGRVSFTVLWIEGNSTNAIVLDTDGNIKVLDTEGKVRFWESDLKGKWFYINAAIPLT